MPPSIKTSRDDILTYALRMVKKNGAHALNARALAAFIGCSTQPIFSNFSSMDALKIELVATALKEYRSFISRKISFSDAPEYKASGMAYIQFAREEKELFKFLFMRDRSNENTDIMEEEFLDSVYYISHALNLSFEKATTFHMEMWAFVHGIATMLATTYLSLEDDEISDMLSDTYLGLKIRYQSKQEELANE